MFDLPRLYIWFIASLYSIYRSSLFDVSRLFIWFPDKVELILEKGYIILKPKQESRIGWEKAFKKMHENGEDNMIIDDLFEDENIEEWSWDNIKLY